MDGIFDQMRHFELFLENSTFAAQSFCYCFVNFTWVKYTDNYLNLAQKPAKSEISNICNIVDNSVDFGENFKKAGKNKGI